LMLLRIGFLLSGRDPEVDEGWIFRVHERMRLASFSR
jgi:hypothetical protein